MTLEEFTRHFLGEFASEHGNIERDRAFITEMLALAYLQESHATEQDITDLIFGVETEGGDMEVPEVLQEKFPLLNHLALYGLSYTAEEIVKFFAERRVAQ